MLILDKRCRSRRHHVACYDCPTVRQQNQEGQREKTPEQSLKYKCAARDLIYALQDMTKHSAAARHNINSALSSPHYPLYDLSSFASYPCVRVCMCLWVWSTFLAQVISAHFMLKSEKPSSASGSERRLGGTHMFSFCGVLVERASSSLLLLLLRCTPEWVKRAWGRQRNCPRLGSRREPNTHIADTLRRSVTWPERSRFN